MIKCSGVYLFEHPRSNLDLDHSRQVVRAQKRGCVRLDMVRVKFGLNHGLRVAHETSQPGLLAGRDVARGAR